MEVHSLLDIFRADRVEGPDDAPMVSHHCAFVSLVISGNEHRADNWLVFPAGPEDRAPRREHHRERRPRPQAGPADQAELARQAAAAALADSDAADVSVCPAPAPKGRDGQASKGDWLTDEESYDSRPVLPKPANFSAGKL